jgi:hypothetical protein
VNFFFVSLWWVSASVYIAYYVCHQDSEWICWLVDISVNVVPMQRTLCFELYQMFPMWCWLYLASSWNLLSCQTERPLWSWLHIIYSCLYAISVSEVNWLSTFIPSDARHVYIKEKRAVRADVSELLVTLPRFKNSTHFLPRAFIQLEQKRKHNLVTFLFVYCRYRYAVQIRSKSLWRWNINTNIMFLHNMHRPVSILDKNRTMDNVQKKITCFK